jgi:nitroreductase
MGEVLKMILSRKSVRKYTGQSVNREDLATLVRAGQAAPSARDKRPGYFIVVDKSEVIDLLAAKLPNAWMLLTARHAIVVAGDLTKAHLGTTTEYWAQDCCAATQNILLAAQELGLGTCWTAAHPVAERIAHVRQVLKLPDHIVPLCVIAVGYPVGEETPKDKYDLSRIFHNEWGNP